MTVPEARGEAVLRAVAHATERFLRGRTWRDDVGGALALLGEAAGADRSYVFQNRRGPDGRLWMQLAAEWNSAFATPIFEQPGNDLHPYYPDFTRWIDLMGSGGAVHAKVSDLPEDERRVLSREGVVSVVAVPVAAGDEWWGFIGLDDCTGERDWFEMVDGLRAVAEALAAAIVRERREEDDRFQEEKFRVMVEQGPVITYIDAPDDTASTLYISPQIEAVLGYTVMEWVDDPERWPKVLHPDDRSRALAENERHNETGTPFRLEYRMFSKDGGVVWVRDEAVLVRDERGMPRYSIGTMMDISERKRTEEQMAFGAYHDELTGLPSRAMFDELLQLSIERASHHAASVAVVVVDVDDFRLVNDSLGHPTGDELLKMVADHLREAARETDLVARRGGDRFLLLLADLPGGDPSDVETAMIRVESMAQRIQSSMSAPFTLAGTELYLSVSIGISVYPHDAEDAGSLLRNAEAAMYEDKKRGSVGYVISSRGALDSTAKLQFVTRLRKAVEAQRWTLYYQPVVELETARMVGVEALIRWIEPDGTMVPPAEFIPLAEELGLIEHIGDWVVRELVYQVQAWKELGIDLDVGFNVSPRQFWQPDFAERILTQVTAAHLDPAKVLVEVTETSAMMDPDRAQEILADLHAGGLSIAIDDFGTGYSSLSRLRHMPVRVLKIDRSFVSGVDADPQNASIVAAFLELANGLGMTTLAEGIETEEELAFLRQRGCFLGQGFLFSKPVPPEEIIALSFGGVPLSARTRTEASAR